jgi:nucleoside-diphosphate-sugar epimerase
MGPRILLLGAGGFIGRTICQEYLDESFSGKLILHFRRRDSIFVSHSNLECRQLDLRRADLNAYAHLIDDVNPDVVINCVGATSGTDSDLHAVNVDVVTKLIAALAGRRDIHLVHIGSAAEYGVQRDGVPVAETALAAPRSVYGLSKYEATRRLMDSVAAGRINVTILRVFNPLGRYSSAATLAGSAALSIRDAMSAGADAIELGSLSSWRDYVDTRDVGRAALAATRERHDGGVILNVGRGEAVQSRQLIAALTDVAGFTGSVIESTTGSERSHAVHWQCADISAIRDQLGWTPRFTVRDSLRELWDQTQSLMGAACS